MLGLADKEINKKSEYKFDGFKYEKKYFECRRKQMEQIFNNIKSDLVELSDYFAPNSVRFLVDDVNKKRKSTKKILDSTPLIAVRNFASGMMTGATSPTRRWFKTVLMNKDIEISHDVKDWCARQAELTRKILYSSNFYQVLTPVYKQLGIFSFSAIALIPDFDTVVKFKLLPIGSYYYSKNYKDTIDTFCRKFTMSAKDLVNEFGIDNVSENIKDCFKNNPDKMVQIVHFVEPNKNYVKNSNINIEKKYISIYYEAKSDNILRKSGFSRFPFVVFENGCNGEDNYPTDGIGFCALPDVKQLMTMTKEYAKAVKKIVSPSMRGPAELKNTGVIADTPGHYNVEDANGRGVSPVYEINPRVLELKAEKDELKEIIKEHFYNDLFAMILNTAERTRTATEINELKEEKMVLLSPLLEQIHSALRQILDWIFFEESEKNILPPYPEILENQEIEIEFVSTLAQAMRAQNIASMERFTTFVANIGNSIDPILLKKVQGEKMIDDYADFANIDPSQVTPTEVIDEYRATIEAKQQQQEIMSQLQAGGQFVKNMGGVDAIGQNLMARVGG